MGLNDMIKRVQELLTVIFLIQASTGLHAEPADCAGCHEREGAEWSESQHAAAMARPGPETVAGDFSGTTYIDPQVTARFMREGESYVIRTTEGEKTKTWIVRYTFGVHPLQQYLIDTGNGRLQAFNIAWDTRDAAAGGQRWFRLDEPGQGQPGDAMHWTGIYQNWNNQCADCHSTGLERNYDPETDSYESDWEHMAVSCTACHESAEVHAVAKRKGKSYGAGVDLVALEAWLVSEGKTPPRPQATATPDEQVPTCGRCHSLRTNLVDTGGGQAHDEFSLSRLDQPLYFSDGRVREEVFVLGSFEQSRMFQAGVACSNCHNPHSGKLKVEGNAVCAQCHNAGDFDTPEHHHHPAGSEGAQCVACHMPKATFMKIDDRREHSFMVPRPDVSKASDSPDVCLACHEDQDRDWSIDTVGRWFPDLYRPDTWHHVQQGSLPEVADYLADERQPAIRRATLLEQQGEALVRQRLELVKTLLGHKQAVIRESAFRVLRYAPEDAAIQLGEVGLDDPALAVRIAAFESLTWRGAESDSEAWQRVRGEYEHYLDMQSDLPSGSVLKARYLLARDRVYQAEQELKTALRKDRGYVPAAILLTDILRSGGRNLEAIEVIDRTLASTPEDARLVHLRGLVHLKLKDYPAALADLERAAELDPEQWLFGYRYAVALYQLQQGEAVRRVTETLLERFPKNPQIRALMRHF